MGARERVVEVTRIASERFRVSIDGVARDVTAESGPEGSLRFVDSFGACRVVGSARGNTRHVWVDGRTLSCEILRGTRVARPREHDLTSPAPGVVAEILASPGTLVRKGEKLVVLESMKMFFPVVAPRDGRVERILCARGETVDAGIPLVELASEGDGG